jgi:putative hydrolase of the HAD superfamily
MIFFDIDGTLMDHIGAARVASQGFQRDYAEFFPEAPEQFARHWHDVAEKHMRRYFDGEITSQEQRRARLRELFANHRQLTDSEADDIFETYLKRYEENWHLYSGVTV